MPGAICQATAIADEGNPAPGLFFNSFDATVGLLTSNQPASVHAGALANDTILSAPNCAIVPDMTNVRTQSQS